MKSTKKLAILVTALIMGTSIAAFTACGNDEWTVTTPPTCETDGVETNGKVTRPIPATGHDYGDWTVTLMPKENIAGSIQRVCINDLSHVETMALPPYSQTDKYKSVEDKGTVISCVFDADGKDVAFDVTLELDTDLGVKLARRNMYKVTDGTVEYIKKMGANDEAASEISFAYGDDYLEIHDEGNITSYDGDVSMYISRMREEGGEASYFFPFEVGNDILNGVDSLDLDLDKFFEKGIPYSLLYAEHPLTQGITFYGAGDLINTLYTIGKADANGDFKVEEIVDSGDGKKTFAFSFGYKGESYGQDKEGYFRNYTVSFDLDENYVLVGASISNVGYSRGATGYTVDAVTGHASVGAGAIPLYYQNIIINHNNGLEKKPENKYKYEDFIIQSFDVTKGGEKLESGATLDMTAAQPITLKLENVNPEEYNTNFDGVELYLVKDDGTLEKCNFMYDSDDWHIKVNYAERDPLTGVISRTLTINPYIAGEQTLLIRTRDLEFTLNLNIATIAPGRDNFNLRVYSFDDVTEEVTWESLTTQEIYVGQPLKFTATVAHPAYEESNYTVSVKNEAGEDVTSACITKGYADGVEVDIFNAEEAGSYTVTLKNVKNTSRTITIDITVKEAPSVADILKGNYENTDNEVAVAFTPAEEGATSGAAEIVLGSGDAAVTTTVNYVFNNANKTIDVTYVSGANDYEYSLELTESYELLLKYKNSRGVVKKMILTQVGKLIDTVSGTYALKGNDGSTILHKVSTTGVYHLSFNKSMSTIANQYYTGYALFDESGEQISFTVFKSTDTDINLVFTKGQSVQIRTMMSPSADATYTFEWFGFVVDATSVALDKTTAEIGVGGEKLTLTANFTPVDTSDKSIKWTSSDTSVATVDENGAVTAVNAGTATITATTVNGLTATCTVTVVIRSVTADTDLRMNVKSEVKYDFAVKGEPNTKYTLSVTGSWYYKFLNSTGTIISSNAPAEITTDENGELLLQYFALSSGTVNIILTKADGVQSVAFDKTTLKLEKGETGTLTVTFEPEDFEDKSGVWTSSDTSVATVDENGVVTAVNDGKATITFTSNSGSKTATCVVTVGETGNIIKEYGKNYGSDTEADYNNALIYQLNVGEGESVCVKEVENAYIVVGTSIDSQGQVDGVIDDFTNLTQGTYYIALYANEDGTTNAWFTVIKNEA